MFMQCIHSDYKMGAIADAPHKTLYEIKLSFSFPIY